LTDITLDSYFQPSIKIGMPDSGVVTAPVTRLHYRKGKWPVSAKGNILLVDDYEVNQIIGKRHLESVGYTVDVAVDGAEAIGAFESKRYDLILMDIEMPVLDGWECTEKIRSLESADTACEAGRVPIIAMSGHDLEGDAGRYQHAGLDDCMAKPIERDILLRVVEKWLNRQTETQPAASVPACEENSRSGSASAPVDMVRAIDEFMGDRDIVERLLKEFVRKGDKQITTIGEALSTADFERIRLEAHALKGGAANLTAYSLADSCAGMEAAAEAAADSQAEQLPPLFVKLKNEFNKLKVFVNKTEAPTGSTGVS
jgi:CheY-like chemotaxis protein/HPt (histidine-containing phosphotransfer) domain-containing protein